MRASIKDVAKEADVSVATVSRVLRDVPGVREKTLKKVLKAIEKLNYEVNAVGRNLRIRKTNIIGVIVGNVLAPFYSIISKAIEDTANESGYNIILCNGDDNPKKELEYLKVLKSNRVDGIIFTPTGVNKEYVNQALKSETNIVLIDRLINGVECDAVLVDNITCAYSAVKHLTDQGYRKIGVIIPHIDKTIGKERLKGYLKALNEAGIQKDNKLIKKISSFDRDKIIDLINELLQNDSKPEAIFSTTLNTTLFALTVLKEKKIKIPDDIGFVSFDDSEWFNLSSTSITAIRQPVYKIGSIATELLINKIQSEDIIPEKQKPNIKIVGGDLLIRESSIRPNN